MEIENNDSPSKNGQQQAIPNAKSRSQHVPVKTEGPVTRKGSSSLTVSQDSEVQDGPRRGSRDRKRKRDSEFVEDMDEILDEIQDDEDQEVTKDVEETKVKRGRGRPPKSAETKPQASTTKVQRPPKKARTPPKERNYEKIPLKETEEDETFTPRSRRGSIEDNTRRSGRNLGKRKDYAQMQDYLKE